jgi:hypothetical protein
MGSHLAERRWNGRENTGSGNVIASMSGVECYSSFLLTLLREFHILRRAFRYITGVIYHILLLANERTRLRGCFADSGHFFLWIAPPANERLLTSVTHLSETGTPARR